MKLLIKEYLASLGERNELDAILPDLISEMGLHVFSRPAIGVRQNGVDLAACGSDEDGIRKVFLFSIKAGDLKRQDWDSSIQALRPSLNEIVDTYIPHRIPKQYSNLPVAICICVGGDIDQNVDSDLRNYINKYSTDKIEFQEWDGDRIANLLLSAVLGEHLLGKEVRSFFKKAVAMLDEPKSSYEYFHQMIDKLSRNIGKRQKDEIKFARQLNLCSWIIYIWSRDAQNLESAYQCSELALLWCWKLFSPFIGKNTANGRAMGAATLNLILLYARIGDEIVKLKYLPNAHIRDGLSAAVESHFSLDVNLKLFDSIGRMALTGILLIFLTGNNQEISDNYKEQLEKELTDYTNGIVGLVNNNGILRTPISDSQSTEISLACLFLSMRGRPDVIRDWMGQVLPACIFAIATNTAYPCAMSDYQDLAEHPKSRSDEDYFKRATAGSTLLPTLIMWMRITDPAATFDDVVKFIESDLPHCTMQFWLPNEASEEHIYTNSGMHGLALVGFSITDDAGEMVEVVKAEIQNSKTVFDRLSAIQSGHWPIILSACRHYRLPIPLNFWEGMID